MQVPVDVHIHGPLVIIIIKITTTTTTIIITIITTKTNTSTLTIEPLGVHLLCPETGRGAEVPVDGRVPGQLVDDGGGVQLSASGHESRGVVEGAVGTDGLARDVLVDLTQLVRLPQLQTGQSVGSVI